MKLTELIKNVEWLSVETVFLKLYPDEKNNLRGYEEVFNNLKAMEPKESDITILVSHETDDFDKIEYVNISGYYANVPEKSDEPTNALALEFTPWNQWLGMEIDPKALDEFSPFEIIVHCLFEMTFMGYEEEEIQTELKKLNDSVEEIKNMTDEEKKEKLISWDDMKKELGIEDEDDDEGEGREEHGDGKNE